MKQNCSRWEDDVKWQLLRAAEGVRPWRSLEETRQCVLCERTFQGRQVRVTWDRCGIPRLRCPTRGCRGTPAQWIHPGNPLISEEAWCDWVRLLDTLCEEPARLPPAAPKKRTRRRAAAVRRS
ncbi:MAG: hypothetical protein PHQ12_06075 [Chthoniobacteraceae bacterium]|nr:hypothetical protein [Chthoniobacteraceae bacterium]